MDPLLADIIRLAFFAIREMERWMRENVRGFRGFAEDERRSYANELGLHLYRGTCACGLEHCRTGHTIAAHGPEVGRPLFVEQAVIGPVGLCANSIDQGMLYRLILREEQGMLVGKAEFKRCANPRCPGPYRLYEGEHCPGDGCGSVFTPEATEVVAQPWLFIQGVYVPVRRWRCRGGEHYFHQRRCRDGSHDPGGNCDHCPWCHCPAGKLQHPQRGTTLWVRRELVGQQAPEPVKSLERLVHEEALRRWLLSLDKRTRTPLRAAPTDSGLSLGDDPLDVTDWLLHGEGTRLSAAQRQALRDMIHQVWDEVGPESGDAPRT